LAGRLAKNGEKATYLRGTCGIFAGISWRWALGTGVVPKNFTPFPDGEAGEREGVGGGYSIPGRDE
jgi:hypothetical protein